MSALIGAVCMCVLSVVCVCRRFRGEFVSINSICGAFCVCALFVGAMCMSVGVLCVCAYVFVCVFVCEREGEYAG